MYKIVEKAHDGRRGGYALTSVRFNSKTSALKYARNKWPPSWYKIVRA